MGIQFEGDLLRTIQSIRTGSTVRTEGRQKNLDIGLQLRRPELKNPNKSVTEEVITRAMHQTEDQKAINLLLLNSPVGRGDALSKKDLEKAGYTFVGTAYHIGAPAIYEAADGSTITCYSGKGTANMGEDRRKIVYRNGRFTQEMYYDDNGKLTGGTMTIRDKTAGFIEQEYNFSIINGKMAVVVHG